MLFHLSVELVCMCVCVYHIVAGSWEIEWKKHTKHRQNPDSFREKNANFSFSFIFLASLLRKKMLFSFRCRSFKLLLSRLPCVPKHWFMFQHDSTLFTSSFGLFFYFIISWMLKQNWNSFLFQRQRLMQVKLHVSRLKSSSDELMGLNYRDIKSFLRCLSRELWHCCLALRPSVRSTKLNYITFGRCKNKRGDEATGKSRCTKLKAIDCEWNSFSAVERESKLVLLWLCTRSSGMCNLSPRQTLNRALNSVSKQFAVAQFIIIPVSNVYLSYH